MYRNRIQTNMQTETKPTTEPTIDVTKDVIIHLQAKDGIPERDVTPSLKYYYENHYYSRSYKENVDNDVDVSNDEFENIAVTKKNSNKFLLGTKVYLNYASMMYDKNIMKYGKNFHSKDNVNFYGCTKLSLCNKKENETKYIIPPSFDNFKICAPIVLIGVGSVNFINKIRIHKLNFNITGRSELKQYSDYIKYVLAIHQSNLNKMSLIGTKLPYTLSSSIYKLKNVKNLEEMKLKLCSHYSTEQSLFASYRFMYVDRKTYYLHDIRDYNERELIEGFNSRNLDKKDRKNTFLTKFTRSLEDINNKHITLQTMIPVCDNRFSPHVPSVPCEHCRPALYETYKKNLEKKEKLLQKKEQQDQDVIEEDYDTTPITYVKDVGTSSYASVLATTPKEANVEEENVEEDDEISRNYDV